jgi:hypothetical protein
LKPRENTLARKQRSTVQRTLSGIAVSTERVSVKELSLVKPQQLKKETRDMLTAPTYKTRLAKEVRSGKQRTHARQSVVTITTTSTTKRSTLTMTEQGEQESTVSVTTHITYNRLLSVTA